MDGTAPDGAISFSTYKMIEFILLFTLPFVWGFWELHKLRRLNARDAKSELTTEAATERPRRNDAAR